MTVPNARTTVDRDSRIDEKDQAILQFISLYPDASVDAIAKAIEMPKPTAQKRIQRLVQKGRLQRILAEVKYDLRYRIEVVVNSNALLRQEGGPLHAKPLDGLKQQKPEKELESRSIGSQEELAKYIVEVLAREERFKDLVIEQIAILLGGVCDLSVDLRARNPGTVREFVLNGLQKLRGVQKTTTAQRSWWYPDRNL